MRQKRTDLIFDASGVYGLQKRVTRLRDSSWRGISPRRPSRRHHSHVFLPTKRKKQSPAFSFVCVSSLLISLKVFSGILVTD